MIEINIPEVVDSVTATFHRYEQALVANDVATLNDFFWKSECAVRYGVAECLYGHEAIAQFRANTQAMDLRRDLMNTRITTYGRDMGSANTEFRRLGSQVTGRLSQVWLLTESGWKIAAAHISLMPRT